MLNPRKPNRLSEYDYSSPGWYFVTICVKDRQCVLGEIVDDKMILNNEGKIVWDVFNAIPKYYANVELDEWVIIPNHIHGIIIINEIPVGTAQCAVPRYGLLSKIVKSFKTITRKQILQSNPLFIWQRSFYDHIINFRQNELENIRDYIFNNPAQWASDKENPLNEK